MTYISISAIVSVYAALFLNCTLSWNHCSFSYSGAFLWNSLPEEARATNSFRPITMKYFPQSYNKLCNPKHTWTLTGVATNQMTDQVISYLIGFLSWPNDIPRTILVLMPFWFALQPEIMEILRVASPYRSYKIWTAEKQTLISPPLSVTTIHSVPSRL